MLPEEDLEIYDIFFRFWQLCLDVEQVVSGTRIYLKEKKECEEEWGVKLGSKSKFFTDQAWQEDCRMEMKGK